MLDWFKHLPKGLIRERPLLCVYQSWALVFDHPDENYSTIKELLMQAQQNLDQSKQNGDFVNTIGGHVASIRALISQPPAQPDHNPHAVLEFLNKARELLPESESEVRSINNVNIGYEYLHLGDTEGALQASVVLAESP